MIYEKQDIVGVFNPKELYQPISEPENEDYDIERPKLRNYPNRRAFKDAIKKYYMDRETKRLKELKGE